MFGREERKPKLKKKFNWQILPDLFFTMLKLSAFTFGGGYTIIPLLHKEAVEKKHWVTDEQMLDIVAVAQTLPGAIAVNCGVLIGYKLCGIFGALTAVLGTVLPPLIILSVLTLIYQKIIDHPPAVAILEGLRAGVVAVIIQAVFRMGKKSVKDVFSWTLAILAFIAVVFLKFNAIFIIIGGGIVGLLTLLVKRRRGEVA